MILQIQLDVSVLTRGFVGVKGVGCGISVESLGSGFGLLGVSVS